jgi:dTDP-4-dehydrorhamnose 3,5-epimerase
LGARFVNGFAVTPERRIPHARGDILHAMKRSSPGFRDFGEAYFSTIRPHDIKGWKRHRRMTLNLIVPVGRVRFVLHDGREFEVVELGEAEHARLTVEPGLWMAFQGLGEAPSLVLNIADIEHDPAEVESAPIQQFPFNWPARAPQ